MHTGTNGHDKHSTERLAPILNRMHREIGVLEECTDALLEDAMEQMRLGGQPPSNPLITGWSIQIEPDGRHHFVPFGNARLSLEGVEEGWREPHVVWRVGDGERELVVEVELPGARKDEIHVQVDPEMIRITAEGRHRRYEAEFTPGLHLGRRCRARYDNGILELRIALAKRTRGKVREVKVKG